MITRILCFIDRPSGYEGSWQKQAKEYSEEHNLRIVGSALVSEDISKPDEKPNMVVRLAFVLFESYSELQVDDIDAVEDAFSFQNKQSHF